MVLKNLTCSSPNHLLTPASALAIDSINNHLNLLEERELSKKWTKRQERKDKSSGNITTKKIKVHTQTIKIHSTDPKQTIITTLFPRKRVKKTLRNRIQESRKTTLAFKRMSQAIPLQTALNMTKCVGRKTGKRDWRYKSKRRKRI